MGVPRHRRTKSKQGNRRSHLALKKLTLASCSKCGSQIRPHTACYNCGSYKGRQVIDVMAKAEKRKKKKKSS